MSTVYSADNNAIIQPTSNSIINCGTIYEIKWNKNLFTEAGGSVSTDVILYIENNDTIMPISTPNDGVYEWNVPLEITNPRFPYWISVTNFIDSDLVDGILIDDLTGPTDGSILINNGDGTTYSRLVQLQLSVTDNYGVQFIEISSDNGATWSGFVNYNPSKSWNLPDTPGLITLQIKFYDYGGNVSPIYEDSITYAINTSPSAPANLTAEEGNQTIILRWDPSTDAESNLAGYRIYKTDPTPVESIDVPVANLADPTNPSFEITGLVNGTSYTYKVTAYDAEPLESGDSNVVTATPVAPPPDPVTNFTAIAGDTEVALSWNKPGTSVGREFTLILRKEGVDPTTPPTGGTYYNTGELIDGAEVIHNSGAESYPDTGLNNGTTYYYRAYTFTELSSPVYSTLSASASATPTATVPTPAITSIAPTSGPVGTVATIEGSGLDGATSVQIGSINASIISTAPAKIEVTVPDLGAEGPYDVTVTTPGGTDTLAGAFTFEIIVIVDPPVITNITPLSGPVGTVATIEGNYFQPNSTVDFGVNSAGTVIFDSVTQLTVVVPDIGSGFYPVTVNNPTDGTSNTFAVNFEVPSGTVTVTDVPSGIARNHPNPFDPTKETTRIIFNASELEVRIILYDLRGRALWTKAATSADGYYEVEWDGKSDFGQYVGNGSYIYLITADGKVLNRGQLMVLK
jgi:hypothetical protein